MFYIMKLTKRKGFNFFRSYFDVYNELSDEAKLQFIDALLTRQFLGVKPKDLKGMAKFAYISQTNSIDSQVKGFEDKTGIKLTPTQPPTVPPTQGVKLPPTLQVEEKGEVEGEEEEQPIYTEKDFLSDWNELRLKHTKLPSNVKAIYGADRNNFSEISKDYTREDIRGALVGLFKQEKFPNDNTQMRTTPKHFLSSFNNYHGAFTSQDSNIYGKKEIHKL